MMGIQSIAGLIEVPVVVETRITEVGVTIMNAGTPAKSIATAVSATVPARVVNTVVAITQRRLVAVRTIAIMYIAVTIVPCGGGERESARYSHEKRTKESTADHNAKYRLSLSDLV
tara:strand:- start:455 stop:802 length:348 start_codon:yes stop_codon:yes gene_type:complete